MLKGKFDEEHSQPKTLVFPCQSRFRNLLYLVDNQLNGSEGSLKSGPRAGKMGLLENCFILSSLYYTSQQSHETSHYRATMSQKKIREINFTIFGKIISRKKIQNIGYKRAITQTLFKLHFFPIYSLLFWSSFFSYTGSYLAINISH